MKQKFLKFPQRAISYSHNVGTRRHPFKRFAGMAFKTDGTDDEPTDEDPAETPEIKAERKKLMEGIRANVAAEMKVGGYKNGAEVTAIIETTLKGVNLEALRKFDTDKTEKSIRNIAAELEKVKQTRAAGNAEAKPNALRKLLDDSMEAIGLVLRSREAGKEVVLSIRAAAVMTTENTIAETDIPDDIIESFSVDAFVKKRRPKEYIFDFASRRTVSEITENKTWLEEGDEQGAFALVTQGAVKPLVSTGLVRNNSVYKKIAGKYVITEEFEKFRKNAYNIIQDLFNDKLIRDYSRLLTLDLINVAAAYVGTTLDGMYATPTDYHAIGAVAAQIESLDFVPDVLILNPQDKWRIGLSANSQGTFFMNIPMMNPAGEITMMGFGLITTNRIDAGNFILGESKLFKIEDEPVQIRIGQGIEVTKADGVVTDVSSDFDNNRKRVIVETFFHDYIASNHVGSFVYANFADVKAALVGGEV